MRAGCLGAGCLIIHATVNMDHKTFIINILSLTTR